VVDAPHGVSGGWGGERHRRQGADLRLGECSPALTAVVGGQHDGADVALEVDRPHGHAAPAVSERHVVQGLVGAAATDAPRLALVEGDEDPSALTDGDGVHRHGHGDGGHVQHGLVLLLGQIRLPHLATVVGAQRRVPDLVRAAGDPPDRLAVELVNELHVAEDAVARVPAVGPGGAAVSGGEDQAVVADDVAMVSVHEGDALV
jgi:hypothetical protein